MGEDTRVAKVRIRVRAYIGSRLDSSVSASIGVYLVDRATGLPYIEFNLQACLTYTTYSETWNVFVPWGTESGFHEKVETS